MNIYSKFKQFFLTSLKITGILITMWCLGLIALILVYKLPTSSINKHVSESATTLQEEGVFPVLTSLCTSQLDNWTDSTMLIQAAYDGKETLLNKALIVYGKRIEGLNPQKSLVEYYINDNKNTYRSEYPRYWHGYLLFLKPLLFIMNYNEIRILNGLLQSLFNISVIYVLFKNNFKKCIIPYALSVCLIMPLTLMKSLQFSTIFYIFSIATIVLMLNYKKWKDSSKIFYFFLFVGLFTSYFDFLTYPLATFGIPFVFLLCLRCDYSSVANFKTFIKTFCSWLIGYGGMWSGKWILSSLLTEHNVILDALETLLFRTSATSQSGDHCSILHVLNINITAFIKNPLILIVALFVCNALRKIIKHKKVNVFVSICIPYICVISLPLLWYIFTRNHSWPHYFFTYKALIVSSFGGMCLLLNSLENK